MITTITVSVGRGDWPPMKKEIDFAMTARGYRRLRSGTYATVGPFDQREAREVIDLVFDIEAKWVPARVKRLQILSPLNVIDMRLTKH